MSHLNSLLMWNDLKLIILFIFIFRIITSIILLFDFFRQIISHYFWSSRSMNFSFWHIKFSFGSGFEYILNSQLKLACKFPSYSNCFNCVFELLNFSCSSDRSGDIRIINDPGHSQLCHRAIELFSQFPNATSDATVLSLICSLNLLSKILLRSGFLSNLLPSGIPLLYLPVSIPLARGDQTVVPSFLSSNKCLYAI